MKSTGVEQPNRARVYRTVSAATRTGWFIAPLLWNLAINFGANYGLEYGTLCQWGKDPMVDMQVWKLVHVPKSLSYTCIALDVMATAFMVAYFTCLLGPGMVVDAVKKGKLAPVAEEAVSTGVWRFFPMRTKNICKRSLLLGVEFAVTFGVLTTIIWTIALGNGSVTGYSYCWFKAIWATFLACMIYPISHFSAISTDKFTEEQLSEARGLLAGSKPDGDDSRA